MTRAAANVSRLSWAISIPKRNLSRIDNEYLYVYGMCALSADKVLLACGAAGLRAVSLHNAQLVAHESSAIRDNVWGVAFDAHTDTLLLLVLDWAGDYYQLVSLRRNASEWREVQRLGTRIRHHSFYIFNIAVCDSRVMLGGGGRNRLYVFAVSAEHTLRDAGNVTLQSVAYGVACTRRDGVTLVAFSNYDTSVSFLRLTLLPLRLVPLASVSLTTPKWLLFREDLLLVADWNRATRTNDIVLFRASDNELTERRVLHDAQAGVSVHAWALAGDRLVFWNGDLEELRVYAFT